MVQYFIRHYNDHIEIERGDRYASVKSRKFEKDLFIKEWWK